MSKPTGAICNLDCEYCFFLSKDELYPGSGFRMDPEVHEAYIGQLLAAQRGVDEVVVAFQGGEPTLMGSTSSAAPSSWRRVSPRRGSGSSTPCRPTPRCSTTSGARFLRDHDFLVGVSIDGPREMHDAYRVDKGGKPTFDRVIRGLDALKRHGVEWNALTTVNAANGDHGREVYTFLRDELGATFVQLIPIVERVTPSCCRSPSRAGARDPATGRSTCQDGDLVTHRTVSAQQYGRSSSTSSRSGPATTSATSSSRCSTPPSPTGWAWTRPGCASMPAPVGTRSRWSTTATSTPATTTSSRTTCSATSRRDARCSSSSTPPSSAPSDGQLDTLPAYCRSCDVRFACNGGCPKDRFLTTPDGEPGLHYLCEGYQLFFRHVDAPMRVMAALLRQGRDATALREWYARADARRDTPTRAPARRARLGGLPRSRHERWSGPLTTVCVSADLLTRGG